MRGGRATAWGFARRRRAGAVFSRGGASRDGGVRRSLVSSGGVRCRVNVLQCDASLLSAARRHAGVSRPSPQLCCPAGRSRARRSAKKARPQWRPICSAGRAPNRKLISQTINRDLGSTHLARGPPRCPSWRPFRLFEPIDAHPRPLVRYALETSGSLRSHSVKHSTRGC